MSRRLELTWMGLLAAAALLRFGPPLAVGIDLGDEGWLVTGVARVAAGEALYREIYRTYPPGLYWALAPIFRLLEPDVLHLRIVSCLLLAGLCAWTYALARPFAPRWAALFAGAVPLLAHPPLPRSFILLAYVATLALCRGLALGGGGTRACFGFGLGIGAVGLLRQDAAAFGALVGAATLAVAPLLAEAQERDGKGQVRSLLRGGLAAAGGAALVWIPVLAVLAIQGSLAAAFDQLVLAGLRANAVMDLPLPELSRVVTGPSRVAVSLYYLPAATALAGIALIGPAVRARALRREQLLVVQWTLFSILVHSAFLSRSDWSHITPVLTAPALLLACVAGRLSGAAFAAGPARVRAAAAVGLVVIAVFGVSFVGAGLRWARVRTAPARSAVALDLPRAALRVGPARAAELRELVAAIRERSEPGEPIFVAGYAPMLYFLADRPNPTRHDVVIPGFARPEAQDEIVEALERSGTRLVVLERGYYDHDERRQLPRYARRLWRHLTARYRAEQDVGSFTLFVRADP